MSEEINVSDELIKCLKSYGADIVLISECEFDYPHIVLIYLKEGRVIHYMSERNLSAKRKRK